MSSTLRSVLRVLVSRYGVRLVWLALLCAYVLAGAPLAPLHGDETTHLWTSRDYFYAVQGSWDLLVWRAPPPDGASQDMRLLNGTLARYLMGFTLHASGYGLNDIPGMYDWNGPWDYNTSKGFVPSETFRALWRVPSSLLLAASVVVLFVLAQRLGGLPVAYLATLVFALNPAVLLNGRRAMQEGGLLCTTLLVVLLGVLFVQRPRWLPAALLGAAMGLALAAKHPALFTLLAVGGGGALAFAYDVYAQRRTLSLRARLLPFGKLALAGVAAVGVFFALNPVYWGSDLPAVLRLALNLRTGLLDSQVLTYGGYADFADQTAGFLRQTFIVLPQYWEFPGWGANIVGEIARYEASLLAGVSLGGSPIGGALVLALCVFGARTLWEGGRVGRVVLLWALTMLASVWLLTPMEWQRYYVPVYPAVALLLAFGVTRVVVWVLWSLPRR